jgi:crotonobetainyl-CoA:carnitine CoA-transferase CaiB-like acyl-CoA transferase
MGDDGTMPKAMNGACSGLRVLDLTAGFAGPMATMVLADFGAEVVRVEPAGGDSAWDEPAYLLLHRGKKSIDLDVRSDAGREELRRIVPGFDVVIESLGPGVADELGIGYDDLAARQPALVVCSITGWGPTGPLAHLKADDALVMAKAGILRKQPGWTLGRPTFRASRDASYFAGMLAVQGILAALRVRDLTGAGQLVETNLLHALTCRQNPSVRWLLREGEELPAEEGAGETVVQSAKHVLPHHLDPRQTNLIGARFQTKDGRWMVHSHTEPHFFPAWIKVLGLDWIWEDERYKGAPHDFPTPDDRSALLELAKARMAEKTAAEWIELYLVNGNVCGDVIQTTQEALTCPQIVHGDYLVEVDDPRVGHIVEIGPLAKLPAAPASVTRSAPLPGEHTAEVLGAPVEPRPVPAATTTVSRPLEGVVVLECAYYYATPFATSLLSELGARVIKIEPLRGDPYRSLANAGNGDPVLNLGHNNMVRAMQGKEAIALNLKDPAGQEILRRLVAMTDVFIHSFRQGVPESLGIDEASLREIKPDLLYQYGASYGSTGPYARQPAIDPIIAAFAGTTAHQSGKGNPPLTETGADPVAAAGHATAALLGIYARHRSNTGHYLESSMIASNIYLNAEDALAYESKPPRHPVDQPQLGYAATYRLYETAPVGPDADIPAYANRDPRWVFFAAFDDDEFARFCEIAGRTDLLADPRFATRDDRDAHDEELATVLEAIFPTRTGPEWETASVAAGVGCLMADAMSHFAFLYTDPQAKAIGMLSQSSHPSFGGAYSRYAPMVRFSKTPGHGGAYCEFGEHTRSLLAELGYSEAEALKLKDAGVVTWSDVV